MKLLIVAFSFCIFFSCGLAQAGILDVQKVTSSSGINAWLVEDHSVPVISLRFMFKGAGALNDPQDKQGLSQILSNMLDEGAGDLDSRAFQEKLNDYSIGLGFSSSRDDFGGSVKTLSKYQETAFELLALALTVPRFDKEPLSRMVESNLVRIRSNMTDPEWMNARLTNATVFGDHPYSSNTGGTLSSLPRITQDDLRQKFKEQLGRDRLIVAVAGDIDAKQLALVLDSVFGKLPASSSVKTVNHFIFPEGQQTVLYQQDIPQTVINMVMPGIRHQDPDYHTAEIVDFVFGSSGFGSRLTEEIREKRGLTYGISSDLGEMDYSELMTVSVSTKTESVTEVIGLIRKVIASLSKEGVTEQELKDAKTYLVGSIPLTLTSTDRISSVLMSLQALGLPENYLDKRAEALNNVSRDDALRVAQRLFSTQKEKIILVGNPKMGDTWSSITSLPNVE